jgi:hypothetical protein
MSHAVEDIHSKRLDAAKKALSIPAVPHCEAGYGYGRFIGADVNPHVGIERLSRLIPLTDFGSRVSET